ncbi:MAG: hypothetical protein EBV03_04505 [Proteobacteria bacterium]|nr:hypothetical protein [Pseudomonadota bacterium]
MGGMGQKTNYLKVKEKIAQDGVRIIGMISPPRVVSTALEIALAESPDVDGQINEPFHLSVTKPDENGLSREERAYADILRRIEETQARTGRKNVTLVMKEMAKNIAPGDQFTRWVDITDKHIVLVRNPLSNTESIIRKVSDIIEERPDLVNFNLNDHAADKGYHDKSGMGKHWQALVEHAKESLDYRPLGPALAQFFPSSNLYRFDPPMQQAYLNHATDEVARKAGSGSLNEFAQQAGFPDWKTMRQQQPDTNAYKPILDVMFAFRNAGWESLHEHRPHLHDRIVVDSTVLRSDPDRAMSAISDYLGIRFDPKMVSGWERASGSNFDRGHEKKGSSTFIYKAVNSTGFNKPQEKPMPVDRFPEQFQPYLLQVAIPAYISTLQDPHRIGPTSKSSIEDLLDDMVMPGIKLRDRDPVFAYAVTAVDKGMSHEEKAPMLKAIRAAHAKEYGDAFDAIDKSIHVAEGKGWKAEDLRAPRGQPASVRNHASDGMRR